MIRYARFEVALHGLSATSAQLEEFGRNLTLLLRTSPIAAPLWPAGQADLPSDVEVELVETAGREEA